MIEHERKQVNYRYNNIICFFFYGPGGVREYVALVRWKNPCVRRRHVDIFSFHLPPAHKIGRLTILNCKERSQKQWHFNHDEATKVILICVVVLFFKQYSHFNNASDSS